MNDRRALLVCVRGRVQGVWFRASCAHAARAAGVAGWVRNAPDGSVEALFEGEATAVQQMQAWCATGPPGAAVDLVEAVEASVTGVRGFEIRG